MTRIVHSILQALGFVVSTGTLATDFVPSKYKPWVVVGVSAAQGVLGWYNHSFNPDGTPSSVAYVAKLLILCLLLGSSAMAQTPPNDDVNVSVTTEYIHFTNGASGTMIEAVRPITEYFSLGYAQVVVPTAKSQFYLLGPRYDTDLQHIFKNSKPAHLDLSLIKVFAGAGLGTRRDDLGNNPTFAYGAHAGLGIGVGTLLKAKIGFNVSAGFIGAAKQAVNGPRVLTSFTSATTGQYATGVTLTF